MLLYCAGLAWRGGAGSEYLDTVSRIILESGGVVDKYIGDIAMAFWNAPLPVHHHEKVACHVALASQQRLHYLAKGERAPHAATCGHVL